MPKGKVEIYTVFKGTDREFTGNKKEIANHFNISYSVLKNRTNGMKLSLEEAIDYKINNYSVFKNTNKEFNGTKKKKLLKILKLIIKILYIK